jgi:hypothetical protein
MIKHLFFPTGVHEENFALMKTLTAFFHLLFPTGRKNSPTVNNDQTSGRRCRTATTAEDRSIDMNDAKHDDASFLFFDKTAIVDKPSTADSPATIRDEQKLKNTEELHKVNDEMALRSGPQHNNWKHRVNDDLAACSPIVNPESVVEARESVKVISDLKNILPIITLTDKTRTNKNDAWLPFASFSFLFIDALVKVDLCKSICQPFFSVAELFENQKPVLLAIPIRSGQTRTKL